VGTRQAASGADQEPGPVPGVGGQSHVTQVPYFIVTSNRYYRTSAVTIVVDPQIVLSDPDPRVFNPKLRIREAN
jgi:hypothetical protein